MVDTVIARHTSQCSGCFREIAAGTEVGYSRARGIRHLGGCAPISTEELTAGRARYEAARARVAARKRDDENPYAKHDAANAALYGERAR